MTKKSALTPGILAVLRSAQIRLPLKLFRYDLIPYPPECAPPGRGAGGGDLLTTYTLVQGSGGAAPSIQFNPLEHL